MAGGRPTKLTSELEARIVALIRVGNYIETAAATCGINKTTLYDWLKRGARANSGPYHEFSNAVEKALAEAEARDVARIDQAINENWQVAAWRLERKFPERWGRKDRQQIEHSGKIDTGIHPDVSRLTAHEKIQLVELMRKTKPEAASGA